MKVKKIYKIKSRWKRLILVVVDLTLKFFCKKSQFVRSNINSILVIRLDNLGDILLTRPLIFSLKKAYPQAKVDVLIKSESVNILSKDSWINKIIFYNKKGIIKMLRDTKYDLIIEPKGRLDYAYLTWKLRPRYSVGFGDAGGGAFFNSDLYQTSQNQIEKNKMICESLEITYKDIFPDIEIKQSLMDKYNKYKNYISINPFTSRKEKDWALSKFKELADVLRSKGCKVVFLAEKGKEELVSVVCKETECLFFSKEQLFEFITVIKASKLIIAPDSASIHIAASVGTKSIALYGMENPLIWHPYKGLEHVYVKKSNNVNDIEVNDVEVIVKGLLA